MGFFSRAFHTVTNKIKSVVKPVFNKVKKGWNIAGQVAEYAHKHVIPKMKAVLALASLIPAVQEFAAPALVGLEAADLAIGTGLKYKKKAEGYAKKAQQVHKIVGVAAKIGDVGLAHVGKEFGGVIPQRFQEIFH